MGQLRNTIQKCIFYSGNMDPPDKHLKGLEHLHEAILQPSYCIATPAFRAKAKAELAPGMEKPLLSSILRSDWTV